MFFQVCIWKAKHETRKRKFDEYCSNENVEQTPVKKQKTGEVQPQTELTKDKKEEVEIPFEDTTKLKQEELDLKFAMKLQPKKCLLCLEDVDIDFMHCLQCEHQFCRECLQGYFKSKITSKNFPILCPSLDCKKEIQAQDMDVILDEHMLQKYQEYSLASVVERNPKSFSCCPTVNCSYMFFYANGDGTDFGCPLCKKRYCLNCKVEYHTGSTCDQYQQWSRENGMADESFSDFATGAKFKQCPGCRHWVEKEDGCDHITCICENEFCYICGEMLEDCACEE